MGCGASAAVHETEALGSMEMHGVSPEEKDAELERLWLIYDKDQSDSLNVEECGPIMADALEGIINLTLHLMGDMKVADKVKRDQLKAFYEHKQHEMQRQIDLLRADPEHAGKEFVRKHGHKQQTVSKKHFKTAIDKCICQIILKVQSDLQGGCPDQGPSSKTPKKSKTPLGSKTPHLRSRSVSRIAQGLG